GVGGNGGDGADVVASGGVGSTGGNSSGITATNSGLITSLGSSADAIFVQSLGGRGGNGGDGNGLSGSGRAGGNGGSVIGAVTVTNTGTIAVRRGVGSNAISAESVGGTGGTGGEGGGANGSGGTGGNAGNAGNVVVTNGGALSTGRRSSNGILAESLGGTGGDGGQGGGVGAEGFPGGSGGQAGDVTVTNSGTITTAAGSSTGILALSKGGTGGDGGR